MSRAATVALCFLLLLPSCGYRFERSSGCSLCIPYVEGDREGVLTTALMRAITTSGGLTYKTYGSDFVLRVALAPPVDTNIGFAYAPHSNIVVSNEARHTLTATFSLIDRRTGCCVLGPCEVSSSITYDFEPDLGNVDFHAFSLGQLEMHNLALDAARPPLYALLAQKIAAYVQHF